MKKTIIVDTLDLKSINKAFNVISNLEYKFNLKQVSKIKLIDIGIAGNKILSAKHNINTLGNIAKITEAEFRALKGVGPKVIISVRDALYNDGIMFKKAKKVKAIK